MPLEMFGLYGLAPVFLLVLFRVAGLMLTAPLFSSQAVPIRIKVFMALAMSAAVFPMMLPHLPATVTLGSAMVGLVGELAIGVFLGMGVALILGGVQMAAQLVGQQSGMRLGAVFNPMLESTGALVSQLYYLIALMVFIGLRGDHALVRALMDSFMTVPPLRFEVTPSVVELLMDVMAVSFMVAIRVSGPAVLALTLAFLALGFLSRTIPQLNILSVGFPLQLAVGLAVMAMTLMSLETVLIDGFTFALDSARAGLGLAPMGS